MSGCAGVAEESAGVCASGATRMGGGTDLAGHVGRHALAEDGPALFGGLMRGEEG